MLIARYAFRAQHPVSRTFSAMNAETRASSPGPVERTIRAKVCMALQDLFLLLDYSCILTNFLVDDTFAAYVNHDHQRLLATSPS
jgi:hypothetical protein